MRRVGACTTLQVAGTQYVRCCGFVPVLVVCARLITQGANGAAAWLVLLLLPAIETDMQPHQDQPGGSSKGGWRQ